jgi:acetolactate synthase-1/2/3 large subunit
VVADIRDLLDALLASDLRAASWTSDDIDHWRDRITRRHDDSLEPFVAGTDAGNARAFFESLRRALPRDSILVLDSGLHQILARRYYRVLAPCGLMMPADLQSMGYAIPTAIGARLTAPKRTVVALVGDGGFAMTGLELLTAKREGISLVVIVFVDGSLGQIRMQQLGNYGATHAVELQNPDLRLFAEAIGVGYELAAAEDIEAIVKRSIERSGVTLIEVPVGDTMKIRGHAAMVRTGEATRRIMSPRFSRMLKALFRRRK